MVHRYASLSHAPYLSPPRPTPYSCMVQTRTAQAECEPGHYCVAGARLPCPPGTVGSSYGLVSPSCSGPSLAGYYSGAAEARLGERCGGPRWFCPEGSSSPSEVGAGNYTLGGPPDRRVAQVMSGPAQGFDTASLVVRFGGASQQIPCNLNPPRVEDETNTWIGYVLKFNVNFFYRS